MPRGSVSATRSAGQARKERRGWRREAGAPEARPIEAEHADVRRGGVRGEGRRLEARARIALAVDQDLSLCAAVLGEAERPPIGHLERLIGFHDGVCALHRSSQR